MFDLQSGQPRFTLYGHQGSVRSVRMAPAGDVFVTGGADGRVLVWQGPRLSKGAPVEATPGPLPVGQAAPMPREAIDDVADVKDTLQHDARQATDLARIKGQLDAVARTLGALQHRVAALEETREGAVASATP